MVEVFKQLEELDFFKWLDEEHSLADERDLIPEYLNKLPITDIHRTVINACAFRWFREKYNLRSFIDTRVYDVDSPNQWIYDYQIKMGNGIDTRPFFSGDFDSYEEAELECLIKLIELVKSGSLKA